MTYHSENKTMQNCKTEPESKKPWIPSKTGFSWIEPNQTEPRQTEPDPLTIREQLLQEAGQTITQNRNLEYGEPEINMRRTVELVRAYLGDRKGLELEPEDICVLGILLKVGRIANDSSKKDSWADIAGYAAVGWEVVEKNRI